jgi:hypothetical protein
VNEDLRRIARRLRSAARARGVPLDKVLLAAEALAGVLVGLIVATVLWQAARATLLDCTVTAELRVLTPAGREQEAAETLIVARVEGSKFQTAWSGDADREGLGGSRQLTAAVEKVSRGEEDLCLVVLTCRGRPPRAVARALVAARNRLTEPEKPFTLKPRNFDAEEGELTRRLAGLEEKKSTLEKQASELQPSPEESERKRQAHEAHESDLAAYREEHRKLEALTADGREGRLSTELAENQAMLEKHPKAVGLSPAEQERLRGDLEQMETLLNWEALEDSTEEHPVRKRMAEISSLLEASRLPARNAELRAQVEKITEQRAATDRAARKSEGSKKTLDEVMAEYKARDAKRDRVKAESNTLAADIREAGDALRELRSRERPVVKLRQEGVLLARPPRGGWALQLVLAALGLAGALMLHRRVLPMMSMIHDETELADGLRVPVLGRVPRLTALERR